MSRALTVSFLLYAAACRSVAYVEPEPLPEPAPREVSPAIAGCTEPFEIPAVIEAGRTGDAAAEMSSILAYDMDGDGCVDATFLALEGGAIHLTVAYGAAVDAFEDRFDLALGETKATTLRGAASELLAIVDVNEDRKPDIVTAEGVAINGMRQTSRTTRDCSCGRDAECEAENQCHFDWRAFDESVGGLRPVGVITLNEEPTVVRGTNHGVERCDRLGTCDRLEGMTSVVDELVVADFDGDNAVDIIAGGADSTMLWTSEAEFENPSSLAIPAVDLESADVDDDGDVDLIAQEPATAPETRAHTQLFLNVDGAFEPSQRFENYDHGNDAAMAALIDEDDCMDYVQVGSSVASLGVRFGDCTTLGDASRGWEAVATARTGAYGVQCTDLNSDGQCDLVIRTDTGSTPAAYMIALVTEAVVEPEPEPEATMETFHSDAEIPIPDGVGSSEPGAPATSTITIDVATQITSMRVTAVLSHPWLSDLSIELQAPDGTIVPLLVAWEAETSGRFTLERAVPDFVGQSAMGEWTLLVWDFWEGDVGELSEWWVTIE